MASALLLATAASAVVAGEPDWKTDGSRRDAPKGTVAADAGRLPAPVLLSVELLPDPSSTPRALPDAAERGAEHGVPVSRRP